jgi:hypothetical protein
VGLWDDVQQQHYAKVQGLQQEDDHNWLSENYWNKSLGEQARVDPVELRKHTTLGTFDGLIKARNANRPPIVTETTNAYIKRMLQGFEIDLNKKDPSDAERAVVKQFYARYTEGVQKFVDKNGYTPSEPELQAIVRGVAAESDLMVDKIPLWWDSLETGPAFQVQTDENIAALEDQLNIPAADLRAVMQYMTEKGIPLTKQNLVTTYQAGSQ